jgi:hypothetical protein
VETRLNRSPFNHLGVLGLALLVAILAVGGCGLTPDKVFDPQPPPHVYPARTAPESALIYLSIAWQQRDSLAADSVYADGYVGTSQDQTDPTPTTISFAKTDEVKVFAGLAKDRTVISTGMDLHPTGWLRTSNPVGYGPECVTISIPEINIYVSFQDKDTQEATSRSLFFFTVKPVASAPGDTLWQIVHWEENRLE